MSNRVRRLLLGAATTLAVFTAGSSLAHAGVTSIRTGTCLHRSSDGYNGCWDNAWGPGRQVPWGTYGCDTVFVRFDSNTPAYAHGVGRTNGIAGAAMEQDGSWVFGPLSGWAGLGGLTAISIPNIHPNNPWYGARVFLGRANSFANVRVQASGGQYCRWNTAVSPY